MNEFTLTLNVDQVNTILNALAEMPFKVSNQLINDIAQQCKQQQTAAAQPADLETEAA